MPQHADLFSNLYQDASDPLLQFEAQLWASGFSCVAGCDEAGRGPLAGPVVAACCILPKEFVCTEINDSKALSEAVRLRLFQELTTCPRVVYSVGIVDHAMIDQINILRATLRAMKEAVEALSVVPDFVLVDGRDRPFIHIPCQPVIQGDAKSRSIAAASIIAKVTRDKMMDEYDAKYPEYGFSAHKGYGTKAHLQALREYGPCPIHRKSFGPVKNPIVKM